MIAPQMLEQAVRIPAVLGLLLVFTLGCTERNNGEAHPPAEEVRGCEVCELLPSGAQFRGGPFESDDLLVYESSFWKVYLFPDDQRYLGRSVAALKRHSPSLADLTPTELDDLQVTIRVMEAAVRREFGAANFNWTCLMNNAFRDNPPKPHVHLHFRPRYAAPVKFGGAVFEDVEFGEHYDRERAAVPTEMALAITAALRTAVEQAR